MATVPAVLAVSIPAQASLAAPGGSGADRSEQASGVVPDQAPPNSRMSTKSQVSARDPERARSVGFNSSRRTVPAGASRASRIDGRAVTLSPDSFYYQDISKAPLANNSAQVAGQLAKQVADRYQGTAAFNAYHFNTSFYAVPKETRRVNVTYWNCQNKSYVPSGLYDGAAHFKNVPIPANAVAAAGTDGELTIYDKATDQIWEFWKFRRNPQTNAPEACWGGRIDKVSANQGIFDNPYGVTAAGLLMAGGMISIEDVKRGEINHAMYLTVVEARRWETFSWPANRSDGQVDDPNVVMQGQRLRLDPKLDLSRYDLTPVGLMVAKAAQKYGFVVSDKAGAVAVVTESGTPTKQATGTDPWPQLLGGPSYSVLQNFPWDKLQVLPKDYGGS